MSERASVLQIQRGQRPEREDKGFSQKVMNELESERLGMMRGPLIEHLAKYGRVGIMVPQGLPVFQHSDGKWHVALCEMPEMEGLYE